MFRKRERGLCRGAGDEITLAAGNPHLAQAIEIFTAFDPFGDQCGIADPGQILHGAYEMVLDAVIGDAMYKMLVDLDEFRLQLGPHAQVGETFTQIVDGDLETAPAIVCKHRVDVRQIGHALLFGQFEHDAMGGQTDFIQ